MPSHEFSGARQIILHSWIYRSAEALMTRLEEVVAHAKVTHAVRECSWGFLRLPHRRRLQVAASFAAGATTGHLVLRSLLPARFLPAAPGLLWLAVTLGLLAALLWLAGLRPAAEHE